MQLFLRGTGITLLYIACAAGAMLAARRLIDIPDELFRKILHFILLGIYIPLVFAFEAWWMAVVFAVVMIILLYPMLSVAERIPMFSSFVNERQKGEFKKSMALAFGMAAFSALVCWGLFGDKYLVLASVYAWGVGDAFAALIGKRFGRHKIRWKHADQHKSVEGSLSMFVCAVVSVMAVLIFRGGISLSLSICTAVFAAGVCTVAEMCAKGGYDTVICPISAMTVIIPMVTLLGG